MAGSISRILYVVKSQLRSHWAVNEAALRQLAAQPLTHDNLAPTLLGLLGVRTSAVRVELDLMALARRAAPP